MIVGIPGRRASQEKEVVFDYPSFFGELVLEFHGELPLLNLRNLV